MFEYRQCQPGSAGCQILACVCIALASMMSVTVLVLKLKEWRHSHARLRYTIGSGEKHPSPVQEDGLYIVVGNPPGSPSEYLVRAGNAAAWLWHFGKGQPR
jgi:hypothetical protein